MSRAGGNRREAKMQARRDDAGTAWPRGWFAIARQSERTTVQRERCTTWGGLIRGGFDPGERFGIFFMSDAMRKRESKQGGWVQRYVGWRVGTCSAGRDTCLDTETQPTRQVKDKYPSTHPMRSALALCCRGPLVSSSVSRRGEIYFTRKQQMRGFPSRDWRNKQEIGRAHV